MRFFLFLCVSVALLYVIVSGDHHGKDHKDPKSDHKESKHDRHRHSHGTGKRHYKHGHHKHHHSNESMDCHKIAPSNSEFAFNLYKQVAAEQPKKNIFFSPVSISTALALISLGARAETHGQIIKGLGFNTSEISEEEIHDGFQHLLHVLNDPDSELQLSSGNALFIRKELKLLQSFLEDAKNFYKTEAFSTDFQNSEEAKSEINSYVGKKTNGKIVDFLSSVDSDTVLILVNYIFFRGKWENPFNKESTREDDFHVDENTVVKVPMMFRNGNYRWAQDEKLGCTVVEIPYKGNASAWFILPDQGKLKEVEDAFQKPTIKRWKRLFRESRIELLLPKFSISTSLDLQPELSKLGVTDLFSDQADFSRITGAQDVKVSKALHKAVLNIDEKGTEAAGATVVEFMPMMLPPSIKYNKPFLMTIYSHPSKSILFMGKIVNPTA